MPKKGHSEEQILRALRQAEAGTRVSEICREHGIQRRHFLHLEEKVLGFGPERVAGNCGILVEDYTAARWRHLS